MFHFTRFLVPVDFSDESRFALESVIQLARKKGGAKITLLHVLPPVRAIDYPGPLMKDMEKLVRRREEGVRTDLDEWRKKIPARFSSESLVRRGHAKKQIIAACREKAIDLVVITTHGRCGLKRMARPNLSEAIVRLAPCPVLVFHLRQPGEIGPSAVVPPNEERARLK